MSTPIEDYFVKLLKTIQEEQRLTDKRVKQLFEKIPAFTKSNILARVSLGASQVINPDNLTQINLNIKQYDPGSYFSNNRFYAPISGYYHVDAACLWLCPIGSYRIENYIYRNPNIIFAVNSVRSPEVGAGTTQLTTFISTDLYLAKDDWVMVFVYHNHSAPITIEAGISMTYMSIHLVSII